jgi:tripartite-type tricarboxylate transporter receptor subunit TctC
MKKFLGKIICTIAVVIPMAAVAWPTRPITMVLTSPPGAATDQIARTVQDRLAKKLGVPITVVYKPGADGMIGTKFVVQSNDDHTILLSTGQVNVLREPVGDHTLDNLKAISIVAVSPSVVVTAVDSGIVDAKKMLETNTLTSGAASGAISEFLIKATNPNWVYAGYKGGAPMFIDVMGKHLDIGANSLIGSYSHIINGKLRPLMIYSKSRFPQLPEVPTSQELGVPYVGEIWFGFLGTKSMSDKTIARLSDEIIKIAKSPEFYDKFTKQGAVVLGLDPVESQRYITKDLGNLTKLYKQINR